jgi:hypothetical protein
MSVLKTTGVPRVAETLLQSLGADREFTDDVLGDLAEEFAIRRQWDSPSAVRWWYYREAVRTAPHLLRDWLRRLRPRDTRPLVWAVGAAFVTSRVLVTGLSYVTFWITDIPLYAYMRHLQTTGDGLMWLILAIVARQIVPAVVAGFVAGRSNARAALPNSLLTAAALVLSSTAVLLAAGAPPRLVMILTAVNTGRITLCCLAGGLAAALWRRASSRTLISTI